MKLGSALLFVLALLVVVPGASMAWETRRALMRASS